MCCSLCTEYDIIIQIYRFTWRNAKRTGEKVKERLEIYAFLVQICFPSFPLSLSSGQHNWFLMCGPIVTNLLTDLATDYITLLNMVQRWNDSRRDGYIENR
jgi:hypothetical protein